MKTIVIPFLAGLVVSCAHPSANAQEFKEIIRKEFTLLHDASASTLAIYNIFGAIRVEGYAGNNVIFEIEKTLTANNNTALETAKNEFKLEFKQQNDSIIAYLAEPYDSRPNRNRNRNEQHRDIDYLINLDFVVKVPFNMNLVVSTVNQGDILVGEVAGNLNIRNVNGGITVNNARGITNAGTVNGNIIINYLSNPPGQSSYNTINGDIKVNYPVDLSADMQFKSMHGDFYTDFPNTHVLPVAAGKAQKNEGDGTLYILNKITTIRIGTGGKLFRFETLNGNVYIKKQS